MKYVESYGAVWKLRDRDYRRFLETAASGAEWNLDDFGTQIASTVLNVTDLTPEQATSELEQYANKRANSRNVRK